MPLVDLSQPSVRLAEAAHHGSVRIGVGVSTAPDARQAAVEAAAHARDELAGEAPSLAVLLGSRSHTDKAVDVLDAVQQMVEAPALIGCVAQAIVAGRHEIEDEPAVAVWLASGLAAETFALDFVRTGSGGLITGYRFDRTAHDLHLLLPDPYTFPSSLLIEHLNTDLPGTTVVGGVVSGGRGPGDTRLFRDHGVLTSGLVGVRLPGVHGVPIVSQGCRPIGDPYIVTGADGALITELGGRPPLQRLREIVEGLPHDEQELVSQRPADRDRRRRAPGGSGSGRLPDPRAARRRLLDRGDRDRRGCRGRRDRAVPGP